jgi:hypothetical protein
MHRDAAMGLMEAQNVLEPCDDAFLAWGSARSLERGDVYTQRVQEFVIVNFSHCWPPLAPAQP